MEILTARTDVGTRQTHKGESRAVRTASYWTNDGSYAHLKHRSLCSVDGVHMLVNDLLHIVIGVLDCSNTGTLAPFFIDLISAS